MRSRGAGAARRAVSLLELAVFTVIALLIFCIVMGLIRQARVHDEWSAVRLETTGDLTIALERIRRDAGVSRSGAVERDGHELVFRSWQASSGTTVELRHVWSGRGEPLVRNGVRPASGRLLGFAASGGPSVVVVGLIAGPAHATQAPGARPCPEIVVPLLFRQEAGKAQYPEWVPDRRDI